MLWKPIAEALTNGRQILVGFQGQYNWYSYVAPANGENSGSGMSFAKPTHFTEITPPNFSKNVE